MIVRLLLTYAILKLDATKGIKVEINPVVEIDNNRFLTNTIILQQEYRVWHEVKVIEPSKTDSYPESITSHADLLLSLLDKRITAYEGSRFYTTDNDLWALARPLRKLTTHGYDYTIGWELNGTSLVKWIDGGLLKAQDPDIMLSSQAFLSGNIAYYYLTCTNGEYGLAHGRLEGWNGTFLHDNQLTANVSFLNEDAKDQNVRFNFDQVFTEIPNQYYDRMRTRLIQMKFVEHASTQVLFKGSCEKLSSLDDPTSSLSNSLRMKLTFQNGQVIELLPQRYITRKRDRCTVLIKKSKDKAWVLGLAILRSYSLRMHTTHEGREYLFTPNKDVSDTKFSTDKRLITLFANSPRMHMREW
uniref:AlNc14C6G832 protein n=1 Tax=Albugo laibachii Nc14 TaxID=890382 RepID=F0W156_9STRA|nr:AlNc14C6G832 [Albugo laibachii Nc14]|eukprot:CCA14781.1 AlNc14C6G832 [Albugo laibachii Nc14]